MAGAPDIGQPTARRTAEACCWKSTGGPGVRQGRVMGASMWSHEVNDQPAAAATLLHR
jgi:hypothetical protein